MTDQVVYRTSFDDRPRHVSITLGPPTSRTRDFWTWVQDRDGEDPSHSDKLYIREICAGRGDISSLLLRKEPPPTFQSILVYVSSISCRVDPDGLVSVCKTRGGSGDGFQYRYFHPHPSPS